MLAERFNDLGARLEVLRAGEVPQASVLLRAAAIFIRDDGVVELDTVRELDRDLDRAGIHTSADAKLLRELGQAKGRLGELSKGLMQRADAAVRQYDEAMKEAERLAVAQKVPDGLLEQLAEDYGRLARIVKTAAIFSARDAKGFELIPSRPASRHTAPQSARIALAEFYLERAQKNADDTARKRRDLDLAHELLLRMSASSKEDRDRLRRVRVEVASARERVRSAPVVRSLPDLVRHLRHASRKDPSTAWRSLKALYERAVEAGDKELASLASEAVAASLPKGEVLAAMLERTEAARHVPGAEGLPVASSALEPGGRGGVKDETDDLLAQLAWGLPEDERQALELAAGCSRFFDVEDALTEDYVEAALGSTRPIQRRVPYPTQTMRFEFTGSFDELPNFVISHPGTLLVDLASNRQMVRAYIEEVPPEKPKRLKETAVRVYVLDASGSMHGARARFRDAILIAELNAIRVRARVGSPFDPLYFSFFNDTPTDLVRIETADDATRHIDKLFRHSPAEGQTDITLALMSAFESIRLAQGKDPYLARATVVLVTDGEDGVDLELIRRTQRPFAGLSINLSFISLGQENSDLKSLVLDQRQRGGRAFYNHLSDEEILLARTEFDSGWRTLLPMDVPAGPELLERLLPHLEALDAIAQSRPSPDVPRGDVRFDALFPVAEPLDTGASAAVRYVDMLDAVEEAASLAPAEDRASEAVILLEHLLDLYGISQKQWVEAVARPHPKVAAAIKSVRLTCRPFE